MGDACPDLTQCYSFTGTTTTGCYPVDTCVGFVGGTSTSSSSSSSGGTCGAVGYASIQPIMQNRCLNCHSGAATAGGGAALDSYNSGFAATNSAAYPGMNRWQSSNARMIDHTMPPGGTVPAAELSTMASWVAAGMPNAVCGADGGVVAAPDAGTGAVVQTCNGSSWTGGNGGGMRPGDDCLRCHNMGVAGTVDNLIHDRINCNGVSGVTVEITGSNGTVRTYTTNSAGNFSGNAPAMPYTARVRRPGGAWASMVTPQTNGACNHCHTALGTGGAPGRITAP